MEMSETEENKENIKQSGAWELLLQAFVRFLLGFSCAFRGDRYVRFDLFFVCQMSVLNLFVCTTQNGLEENDQFYF